GGYLLTERCHFPAVVEKILNIDQEVLQPLIDCGRASVYLHPKSDAEKACFELISIIDHV
ncbi:hypothetical protein BKA93DRAFT_718081, partial [Sparassis latifolia]